jgi:serine protease Do
MDGPARMFLTVLVSLVLAATGLLRQASAEPRSFAESAALGRAAGVTLKVAGQERLQHIVVDDSTDEDDELLTPEDDGDAGDLTLGSAVIIDAAGIAVTTARLGRGSLALQAVTSDGRRLTTRLIGRDEETDVAVLSLCCDTRPFPVIALGDSDRVRPGDWVIAVGAPFGLDVSTTASVVAHVAPADGDGVGGVIQVGGSVTAGYAGGPIVDTTGAMIGLVVGNSGGSGIALPSNIVSKVALTVLEGGRVPRGWLGVSGQTLDRELARAFGLSDERGGIVVVDVRRDSPAARVGLYPGAIIHELDGRRLDSAARMARIVASLPPGRLVTLDVRLGGRDTVVAVRLGEAPDEQTDAVFRQRTNALFGAHVGAITSDMGVVIGAMDPDGAAARAGARRGDVIRELNGRAIRSMADFEEAVAGLTKTSRVIMLLQRGPSSFYRTWRP